MMRKRDEEILTVLHSFESSYPRYWKCFLQHLEKIPILLLTPENIEEYISSLKEKKYHVKRKEWSRSYSASWINSHIKAIKQGLRYLIKNAPACMSEKEVEDLRFFIEHTLKQERTKEQTGRKEDTFSIIDTYGTIILSLTEFYIRISFMLQFIFQTGCSVSEMINVKISDCIKGEIITTIKYSPTRTLKLTTELYEQLRKEYKGKVYLFEHNGKQYSRIGVNNQVRRYNLQSGDDFQEDILVTPSKFKQCRNRYIDENGITEEEFLLEHVPEFEYFDSKKRHPFAFSLGGDKAQKKIQYALNNVSDNEVKKELEKDLKILRNYSKK
jgi:integrase